MFETSLTSTHIPQESKLEYVEVSRTGVKPTSTDEIRVCRAVNTIIHGNKRVVTAMAGLNQTDEYVIAGLRLNEDCETDGSPSGQLFANQHYLAAT